MTRFKASIGLLTAALVVSALSPAHTQPPDSASVTLTVIGFTGDARLRIGPDVVSIRPGSGAVLVPPGAEVKVLSGNITFLAEGNVVAAKPGDSFLFSLGAGRAMVDVLSGALSVTKDGASSALGPGQTLTWPAPGAQPLPSIEPAAEPPALEPRAPAEELPALPPAQPVIEAPAPAEPEPQAAAPTEVPTVAAAAGETAEPKYISWLKSRALRVQVELHPYYAFKETYDSNIYLVPPDKPGPDVVGGGQVGAWITSNNLGLNATIPMGRRHKLEAGYDFRALNYSRNSNANDSMDQAVKADYWYTGKRGVTAHLFNHYANTMDPAFSEVVNRERRWQNTAGGRLDVEFSRMLYGFVDGQHTTHKYLGSAMGRILNHYEQSFGGGAGVMVGPKTKAYASYHRTIIHYSAGRQANSKGHSADFGVEGQLTPKLKGAVSVGMHSRRYDDVTGTSITERETTWQTRADVTYAVGRRTQANLMAFRSVNEATSGNNRFYEATGLGLGLIHAWQKFTVGANGSWEVDRYPEALTLGGATKDRRDDLYTAGLRTQYQVKDWLSTGLEYTRRQRHSTFTRQFNYGVNLTSLEVRVSF
ncbi:MAG: outer membrane beta-barrel protein [Elusimicrobia bacterium]|nr:outer membrane beta-barrel protein [Elusimicrobiota bacterium]